VLELQIVRKDPAKPGSVLVLERDVLAELGRRVRERGGTDDELARLDAAATELVGELDLYVTSLRRTAEGGSA
jgi:hypothetical protein